MRRCSPIAAVGGAGLALAGGSVLYLGSRSGTAPISGQGATSVAPRPLSLPPAFGNISVPSAGRAILKRQLRRQQRQQRLKLLSEAASERVRQANEVHASKKDVTAWTAWIYMGRRGLLLYGPVVATLREGFSSFGALVQVAELVDSCKVLEDCKANSGDKRATLVVAIGWMQIQADRRDSCGFEDTMSRLADFGAYIILYNTEPSVSNFGRGPPLLAKWKAKELWSYSRVQLGPRFWGRLNVTSRYVPAGCASELDLNVSMDGANRHLDQVGFVGNWFGRGAVEKQLFMTAFSGKLYPTHGIERPQQWRSYLQDYPLQFNMHATWNVVRGFECLRVAMLVANYACTLSVRSNPDDEEAFRGIVHFGMAKTLKRLYNSLQGNDTAIRQCQEQSRKEFCTRFSPRQLLLDARFEEVLSNLGVLSTPS